ncbi:hypothetical protein [Crossiella cryophila]|uniref:CU044_5270 family protein n=1 Tax=Crossiella cryophila TaxID=43355 RepID=A0A7W7C6C2_9PSEU|nr:hypothetical protein [Crossiella cryophila]MBB4675342.1 hypothetical protein [Crossiella cryophila]
MTEHRVWSEDELDTALAELRPEVSPDPEALAAARARLLTAAQLPAPAQLPAAIPAKSPAPAAIPAQLPAAIPPLIPAQARPRRATRRWLLAAAAVALVTTGALLAQPFSGGGTADARDVLATAARAGDGDRPLRPGEFRYVQTRSWDAASADRDGKTYSYLEETLRETWIPFDETGEWVSRERQTGNRQWTLGVTEAEYRAAGLPLDPPGQVTEKRALRGEFSQAGELTRCAEPPCPVLPPEAVHARDRAGAWHNPTQSWQNALPSDPQALYAALRAHDPAGVGESVALDNARVALRTGRLRTEIRNRVYAALRLVPGIRIKADAVDLGGRHGVSLGVEDDRVGTEIIIEPSGGRFLGERTVVRQDSAYYPRGTVIEHSTVSTAIAAQAGVAPSR